ncbi:MAG: single-stranded-DNA-specific exonuclease RecJ [Atribacterota bacterium]
MGAIFAGSYIIDIRHRKRFNKIKWIIAKENEDLSKDIAHQFCFDPIIAQLLINRGLKEPEVIEDFLNPKLDNLINPFNLQDMTRTVERIKVALYNEEKILIYGDYDVDGITSTALLFSVLSIFSSNTYYYIPNRFEEGYGISQEGIQFAIKYHVSLIITVDCGITSHQEIKQLSDMGIDTIVTDHHEPLGKLPEAYSIINPKNCDYSFKDLAGVGVAFKLAQALFTVLGKENEAIYEHLDLVALGTIADSVPLLGENRILVKYGLSRLINSRRKGLIRLLEHGNYKNLSNPLLVRDISFDLIPILNSTGRIGNPEYAVDLLLTDSPYRANYLVNQMLGLNEERKAITQKVLLEAKKMAYEINLKEKQKILVLSSSHWHPGVIGIVASRIMEEFAQPVIMISASNGIGKGSGRNQGEFDFSKILSECSDLLVKYGGHQYAAGITISESRIDLFRKKLNQILEDNRNINTHNEPIIKIDTLIGFDKMNWSFLDIIEKLRPFGPGNPEPIFGGYKFPLVSWRKVGKEERHLKLRLGKKGKNFDGIAFQMAERCQNIMSDNTINVAFQLGVNCWNGKESMQLMIKDIQSTLRRI